MDAFWAPAWRCPVKTFAFGAVFVTVCLSGLLRWVSKVDFCRILVASSVILAPVLTHRAHCLQPLRMSSSESMLLARLPSLDRIIVHSCTMIIVLVACPSSIILHVVNDGECVIHLNIRKPCDARLTPGCGELEWRGSRLSLSWVEITMYHDHSACGFSIMDQSRRLTFSEFAISQIIVTLNLSFGEFEFVRVRVSWRDITYSHYRAHSFSMEIASMR